MQQDQPTARDGSAASAHELAAMHRALELARRGPAHDPNPQVGCVLLGQDGTVLGEGWHDGAGTPHAEVAALTAARAAGHRTAGSTAVVTLEPCRHTGRTPPCVAALLDAGVARVVAAMADPGAQSGGGATELRAAGVEVLVGVLREQAQAMLRVWSTLPALGRPYVIVKLATSLDGRVAAADGSSRWITSEQSRAHAHARRAAVDAVVVGTGTVATDDPALTARDAAGGLLARQPVRVAVGHRSPPAGARLRGPGGPLVHVPTHDVATWLAELAARGIRSALVEGGPTLTSAVLRSGLVDEVHAYVAPVLLGAGLTAVADLGRGSISEALRLHTRSVTPLGPDVLIVADVHAGPTDQSAADHAAHQEA